MTKPSIIVMGVSGSGKSTIAEQLANKLNVTFVDGDDLHPEENINKMANGTPLNDDDRKPWLQKIHDLIADHQNTGEGIVVVCSSLKKIYRDQLRGTSTKAIDGLQFVYLSGSYELILGRMEAREGHFMKADMLKSQFSTLEIPLEDEPDVITVSIDNTLSHIVDEAYNRVN